MPPRQTRAARAASQAITEPEPSQEAGGNGDDEDQAEGAQPQAQSVATAAESSDQIQDDDDQMMPHESNRHTDEEEAGPSTHSFTTRSKERGAPTAFAPRNPNNHVKILLATDNHVGFMERDPVRGQDSITTFREILTMAVERDVDMVLLGGDLFHENKPSRATMHQVLASLRQHCLSDRPVTMELLSDPNDGRAEGYDFPAINYEDPNLNVGIPVFSIHGNHDDPQGVGAEGALSALDVLSVSGLVNYFGKIELPSDDNAAGKSSSRAPDAGGLSDVGIRIRPVLLQKGATKVALYGMGNIKDERMHYELRANRVRMYRPSEDPEGWFNILCVHQNRAAHNPKACVPETMFDDSIHLVVWGHEHEQRIKPEAVGGKGYYISQPGSSVATSLSPGEAEDKAVAIIHIEETDFYLEPIPLQTVRPFIMDDMALAVEAEAADVDLHNKADVQKLLRDRVYELIDKANADWEAKYAGTPAEERPVRMLPLVRLRVEYEASLDLTNPIRFGQEFVDKVANPKEVLHFTKRKGGGAGATGAAARKKRGGGAASNDPRFAFVDVEDEELLQATTSAEKFEEIKVGQLVREYLERQNLELLNGEGLERAIVNYVDKDDREAIQHFVKGMVKTVQGQLNTLAPDEGELDKELDRIRDEQHRNERHRREGTDAGDGEEGGRGAGRGGSNDKGKGKGKGARTTGKRGQAAAQDSDDSMLDDVGDGDGGGGGGFSDNEDAEMSDGAGASRRAAAPARRQGGASNRQQAQASTSRTNQTATATTQRRSAKETPMFRGSPEDEDSDGGAVYPGSQDEDDDGEDDDAPPQATSRRTATRTAAPSGPTSRSGAAATPAGRSRADILNAASASAKKGKSKATPAAATSSRSTIKSTAATGTGGARSSRATATGGGGGGGRRAAAARADKRMARDAADSQDDDDVSNGDGGGDSDPGFEIDEEASQPASRRGQASRTVGAGAGAGRARR